MKTDYISYWNNKGAYGEIRIERMLERKKKRREKPSKSYQCEYCHKVFVHCVQYRNNPYMKEMYDLISQDRICDSCYDSMLGDI